MNIIQRHAERFFDHRFKTAHIAKIFIDELQRKLYDYKKDSHKLEFLTYIITKAKLEADEHLRVCPNGRSCQTTDYHEDVLFFLQQEIEDIDVNLSEDEFRSGEKKSIHQSLNQIVADLNQLKEGQKITYDDLEELLTEIKSHLFLSKPILSHLIIGKLTEMVASGVVSETASKSIVKLVMESYQGFIGSGDTL